MEVDTGAALSIMSQEQQEQIFPSTHLYKSNMVLRKYSAEQLKVVGKMPVHVQYGGQKQDLSSLIVQGDGPTLLGRSWLEKIRLNWTQIAYHSVPNQVSLVSGLQEVFKDELGTVRNIEAELHLQADVRLKFFHPRHVPLAIRDAIGDELDRLVEVGVLKKVDHSEWAVPIVPVPKKDGKFRICGDCKVTVNPVLEVDQHPLPLPEEIFASLLGGQKFTKLDLSHAYQEIMLQEESQKLVTINTHKGLYQYTRLPFGVASAPAIFQRAMDVVLQGIPNAMCYLDDIMVTGTSDQQHLAMLATVLERLQAYGF